jgi:hypothetical protein
VSYVADDKEDTRTSSFLIGGATAPLVLAFRNTRTELLHELGKVDQAERLFLDVLQASSQ